jgi:hypothetical protein
VDIWDPSPTDSKGKLTIPDLGRVILNLAQSIGCEYDVSANVNLALTLGIAGAEGLPEITANFAHNWAYSDTLGNTGKPAPPLFFSYYSLSLIPSCKTGQSKRSTPSYSITNVNLNVGPTLEQVLRPVVTKIQDKVLSPIQPVLDALNTTVPVIGDIPSSKNEKNSSKTETFQFFQHCRASQKIGRRVILCFGFFK